MKLARTADVVIAGGGIVGAAAALEFAREGFKVTVVEPAEIGGGATAAGMGHIVAMDDSEAQFALTRYSQTLWNEIADELPRDIQFNKTGTLWVAADDDEMREVERKQIYYQERNIDSSKIDSRELSKLEPQLRPGLAGGLLVPGDSVIYPPCAARRFLEQAAKLGSSFLQAKVAGFDGGAVHLTNGERITSGLFVNATGSWAPDLTPNCEVRKRKGHLIITDRYPNFVRHQLVELGYLKSAHSVQGDSVAFNLQPRPNGQLLLGSSRQYGSSRLDVETPILTKMVARALEYLPGLAHVSAIRCWTGFRAATPDKLPLIGPCLGAPDHYLATGHEGLGITTSLGTAKLLVDQVMERPSLIDRNPYLPSRFAMEPVHAH